MTKRFAVHGLILLAWLLAAASMAAAQPASMVGVDTVVRKPLHQTAPVVGRFVACRAGEVAARVSGAIGEMHVEVGDRVALGDVLAVLVRDRFAADLALRGARVAEAEAAVTATQARLALRRQELERLARLRQSPAFSESRYDDKRQEVMMTEADLSEARALVARAVAERQLAEINYRDAEIRAPYPGVVSRRHTEAGEHVSPGTPVVSLIDAACLEIEADVPQARARAIEAGMSMEYDAGAGRMPATVRAVLPEENPLTRTRTVRFTPDVDPATDPASGQSVTVWVPVGAAREVLTVHKDAVLSRGGERVVYVVEDGKAAVRQVELGEAVDSRFEVLDGLSDGDVVVVRGNERLRPGQPVQAGAGPAPGAGGRGGPKDTGSDDAGTGGSAGG